MKNVELWNQLQEFKFDLEGAAFPFSRRLAADNGWSEDYALRVIEEYRRFLYLGICADHPVTPSDEVDQAWHLHMVYTRSYWEDLCGKVLGKPFHHGPTRGGETESSKFHDWYGKTLATYEAEFEQPAPQSIWPTTTDRFSNQFQRINTRQNWVISKSTVRRASTAALAGIGAVSQAALLSSQNSQWSSWSPWDASWSSALSSPSPERVEAEREAAAGADLADQAAATTAVTQGAVAVVAAADVAATKAGHRPTFAFLRKTH